MFCPPIVFEARKLKGDGTGAERPVPMNDLVEIALHDAAGKSLYRNYHRVGSGLQTIELTVTAPPARAVVDPDHELLDRNPKDNAVSCAERVTSYPGRSARRQDPDNS